MRDFYLFLEGELPLLLDKWRQQRATRRAAESRAASPVG